MPRPPACCNNKQQSPTNSSIGALLLREDSKDGKYINNYIPTIILHVYFSNDVASLQKSDVTESESDDCQ